MGDAQGLGQFDARKLLQLGQEDRLALPGRDRGEGPLELTGEPPLEGRLLRRGGDPARLAGPGHEAHDAAAAQLVEGRAAGDLVQPGAGMRRVLEGVEGAVGLDECLLRQVGGRLGLAHHVGQVGVDLGMVQAEELLHERASRGAIRGHGRPR